MIIHASNRFSKVLPVLSTPDHPSALSVSELHSDETHTPFCLDDDFLIELANYRNRIKINAVPLIRVACTHYLTHPKLPWNPDAITQENDETETQQRLRKIDRNMEEMQCLFADFMTLHETPSFEVLNRFYKRVIRHRSTLLVWRIAEEILNTLHKDDVIKPMQLIAFKKLFTIKTPKCLAFTHSDPDAIEFDPNHKFKLGPQEASRIVTYLSTLIQSVDNPSIDQFVPPRVIVPFGQALAKNLMHMPMGFSTDQARKTTLFLRCGLQDMFPSMIQAMIETLSNMDTQESPSMSDSKRQRLSICLKSLTSPLISQCSEQWYCNPASSPTAHKWKPKHL
jgi:hypothetical protein